MNWREYQARQKVAEIGDRFISYVDEGAGEPWLLLHGIPTWGYLWETIVSDLSPQGRVLVPDLLGFGFSDKSDCFDRSIERQADYLAQWLSALNPDPIHLVAHDIGGGVALRLALSHPQWFRRLTLINTVCYDSWPIEAMLQFGHPAAYRKLSASAARFVLRKALKQGCASTPADEMLDGLLVPYATEVGKLSLIRNASALNTNLTTEITSDLSTLEMPVRILWGEDDRFQLVSYGERLARDIPGAEIFRIKDARHFVMLDKPDEVARLLD